MDLVWSLLLFFLLVLKIEGFQICMPLEGNNGPLKAGFINWMWFVLCH